MTIEMVVEKMTMMIIMTDKDEHEDQDEDEDDFNDAHDGGDEFRVVLFAEK